MEQWDILDKNRVYTGKTAFRGAVLPKTDFHLITHTWIRRKSDGRFLISRRVPNIFWGGFWQPTGGSAVAGETSVRAAIREAREELGVTLNECDGRLLFSYRFTPIDTVDAPNPPFFLDAWLFDLEREAENALSITIQKEEVADFTWATFAEITDLLQNGAFMPFEQTWQPYWRVFASTIRAPQTVQSARAWGSAQIALATSSTPELDAALLLAHTLNVPKDALYARAHDRVTTEQLFAYQRLLLRRATGEPIAYIVGKKAFWNDEFFVNPDVLIPKADTELLVELASTELARRMGVGTCSACSTADTSTDTDTTENAKAVPDTAEKNGARGTVQSGGVQDAPQKPLLIADICTGSGCIVLSLMREAAAFVQKSAAAKQNGTPRRATFPLFYATDISQKALDVAQKNAAALLDCKQRTHLTFLRGDLCEPLFAQNGFGARAPSPGSTCNGAQGTEQSGDNNRAHSPCNEVVHIDENKVPTSCVQVDSDTAKVGNASRKSIFEPICHPELVSGSVNRFIYEIPKHKVLSVRNDRADSVHKIDFCGNGSAQVSGDSVQADTATIQADGADESSSSYKNRACSARDGECAASAQTNAAVSQLFDSSENRTTNVTTITNGHPAASEQVCGNSIQVSPLFDIIVSNPPYVPTKTARALLQDGRNEPLLALDGGEDGLDLIKKLVVQVWNALKKNGILFLETGEYNAVAARELLTAQGFVGVKTENDLGGQPRVTVAIKP